MVKEMTLTLNSPITDEQWDAITDVDFEHTDRIWFKTKHGKEVEFVKRKKGKWINENFETIECSNCNHIFSDSILLNADEESFWDYPSYCPNCGAYMKGEEGE